MITHPICLGGLLFNRRYGLLFERRRHGALKEDEAQRLKALEQENARLKRIVAEQALDISMLKDVNRGNW